LIGFSIFLGNTRAANFFVIFIVYLNFYNMKRFFFLLAVLCVSTTFLCARQSSPSYFKPPVAGVRLAVKVFLQGPYNSSTGLMDNHYGAYNQLPTAQPYTALGFSHAGTETTTNAVLANTFGANSVVDWILLELRNPNNPAVILHSRAALLQRDGDVVDMDGSSAVSFSNATDGNYLIAVRHRNHLGFRTAAAHNLSSAVVVLNFTNKSVALFGITPVTNNWWTATVFTMNGGDANHDGSIDASDTASWETFNGIFAQYQRIEDYNLDGSVDAADSAVWEINNGKYAEFE
jgi:hypothetical protein